MPAAQVFYICNECQSVIQSAGVLEHLAGHLHGSYCGQCAQEVDSLQEHVEVHLKKLFMCPTCDEVYSSSRDYRAHRNTHRLICFHCGDSVLTEESLSLHIKEHHPDVDEGNAEGYLSEELTHKVDRVEVVPGICTDDARVGEQLHNDISNLEMVPRMCYDDSDGVHDDGDDILSRDIDDLLKKEVEAELPSASTAVTKRKRGRPRGSNTKRMNVTESKISNLSKGKEKRTWRSKASKDAVSLQSDVKEGSGGTESSVPTLVYKDLKPARRGGKRRTGKKAEAKVYKCVTCGETFSNWKRLRHHMNAVGCHQCEFCGAKFKQTTNLKLHIRVHTGERPHLCSLCGKKFRTTGGLDDHIRRHKNEKPHQCRQCTRRFVDVGHRNRHERLVHSGLKVHQCTICGKMFGLPSHAKRHALIHTGKKQFECATCGKQILDVSNFKKHLDVHKKRGDRVLPVEEQLINHDTLSTGEDTKNIDTKTTQGGVVIELNQASGCDQTQISLDLGDTKVLPFGSFSKDKEERVTVFTINQLSFQGDVPAIL